MNKFNLNDVVLITENNKFYCCKIININIEDSIKYIQLQDILRAQLFKGGFVVREDYLIKRSRTLNESEVRAYQILYGKV